MLNESVRPTAEKQRLVNNVNASEGVRLRRHGYAWAFCMVLALLLGCSDSNTAPANSAGTTGDDGQSAENLPRHPLPRPAAGFWLAELMSPGGSLPFGLILADDGTYFRATIINGPERIEVPEVSWEGGQLTLFFPHYDSRILASLADGTTTLTGDWAKRRGKEDWNKLAFAAQQLTADGHDPRTAPPAAALEPFLGKWEAHFSESAQPAVADFRQQDDGRLWGTFLTTTGDYRYLAGEYVESLALPKGTGADPDSAGSSGLRLSCFDGAHAFLFLAQYDAAQQELAGDFWSSDTWHETWIANRNQNARLPDGFRQTNWVDSVPLASLTFPDVEGVATSLADERFAGKARIIEVFGSWCPNCHDAASLLSELDAKYKARGLSILGLAFEHTGDFQRDAQQVKRYMARHNVTYPVLLAGLSDKTLASEAFPALEQIRAYPTTIFLHPDGRVRAVYSGFSGPATGAAYDHLRAEFERLIEELLNEAD